MTDIFNEENLATGAWMKFATIGDKCKGILVGRSLQEGKDGFPDQEVYELRQEDDSILNVGISVKKTFVISRMKHAKLGQEVGFLYKEDIESKVKGYAPAKSILVYLGDVKEVIEPEPTPESQLDAVIAGKEEINPAELPF